MFQRDQYTCQFCNVTLEAALLTIDRLIPLALGGLDETTNYVTACEPSNARKGSLHLAEFADSIKIDVTSLPVHGDPVLNNSGLPLQIRMIRKRVFDRMREGNMRATGKSAQKKIEKAYRISLWESPAGRQLQDEMPSLPGQVRVMVPEIRTIAKSPHEYLLLIELAKSANTRNLIGSVLTQDCDVVARVESLASKSKEKRSENELHLP